MRKESKSERAVKRVGRIMAEKRHEMKSFNIEAEAKSSDLEMMVMGILIWTLYDCICMYQYVQPIQHLASTQ
jgi:hypothetical protein